MGIGIQQVGQMIITRTVLVAGLSVQAWELERSTRRQASHAHAYEAQWRQLLDRLTPSGLSKLVKTNFNRSVLEPARMRAYSELQKYQKTTSRTFVPMDMDLSSSRTSVL